MPEDPQASPTPSNGPENPMPSTSPASEVPPANLAPDMSVSPVSEPKPNQPAGFSQPVVSDHSPAAAAARGRRMKRPLAIAGIAVAAAVLIGGGLVFGLYLPNTPDNVYSAGLDNTGRALDVLVAYSKTQENTHYSGADFDGTLKVASPDASFDFGINGSADTSGNATATMSLDLMGNKGTANIRSIRSPGNTSPDVYVQVNGIKSYLDSNGMSVLDSLDGQWISIDHTLIDTYVSRIKDMSPAGVSPDTMPTYAQIQDAATKVQAVNRQYLFSTNASTAVLANEKYLSQTKEGNRTLNHYQVGYNKDHLKAYAKAVAAALDASQLNDWSKQANKGKNLSDVMDFSQLQSDIASSNGDYTFDVWVDTGTKLISKVTFADTDPTDKVGTFTLGQNYTGGDEYPFSLAVNAKDSSGNPQQYTLAMSINARTNKVSMNLDGTSKDASGTTTVSCSLHAAPSQQGVTVTAPAGAKSVNEILNELGLGGLGADSAGGTPAGRPLVFQQ